MSEIVYRDYDSEALYAQYNNRAQISEAALAAIKDDQNARSADYRANAARKHLDLAYGPHGREKLDIFLPESDGAPVSIVAGAQLNFDASDASSGVDNNNWDSLTADQTQNYDFGADVTPSLYITREC